MAGIDKTYLTRWDDYKALENWCISVGEVTDDWGNKFRPLSWLFEWTHEEWIEGTENETEEIPVWNTPTYLDIYLIRYCPLEFIQNRLKQQYAGCGWTKEAFSGNISNYDLIKNRMSEYDEYQRNGVKNPKFKWNLPIMSLKELTDLQWWVQIDDEKRQFWRYDETVDYWYPHAEMYYPRGNWITSLATVRGKLTKRKLARLLQKWNLPKGVTVNFRCSFKIKGKSGRYGDSRFDFKITIK